MHSSKFNQIFPSIIVGISNINSVWENESFLKFCGPWNFLNG